MDEDISPVNELWETVKLCRLVFLHNQLGSEVILLFDRIIHPKSLRSLINVGISYVGRTFSTEQGQFVER